ncbi:MAG: hypothetical protein WCO04_10550 [Pseudomonadota bacterium]
MKFLNDSFFEATYEANTVTIYIHVGFPKCGSTSIQRSIRSGSGIFYPRAGTHGRDSEHISLALFLTGIDSYTRKFLSDEWVEWQHRLMMKQIGLSGQNVFLSSERLAALNDQQIRTLKSVFYNHDVEIVFVVRDREKYFRSTWRHLVFTHDYPNDYDFFREKMNNFDFDTVIAKFRKEFPVHVFSLDDEGLERGIKNLTGANFTLLTENSGCPFSLAQELQRFHSLIGTAVFKDTFTSAVKQKLKVSMLTASSVAVHTDGFESFGSGLR